MYRVNVFQTNGVDCQKAGYGHFSAAINHCKKNSGGGDGCKRVVTGTDYGCGQYHESCSEPLCCGYNCQGPDSCDSGEKINCLKGLRHEDSAVLGQFCAKIIT